MYTSVEQFLAQHYGAICDLMDEAAGVAGGHYAQLTPLQRRQNAEHDVVEFITGLGEGRVDRQAVRASAARPTDTGLVADDILLLIGQFEPRFVRFVERELAGNPDIRDTILRRYRHLNASFRASLTSVQIDRVLQRFDIPPPGDPHAHAR
jgi:hypothetical protein